jgi:hypothetical protein
MSTGFIARKFICFVRSADKHAYTRTTNHDFGSLMLPYMST